MNMAEKGWTRQELEDKLEYLEAKKFYGKLILSYEDGKVHTVKQEETLKPKPEN